jgi:MFS family permease
MASGASLGFATPAIPLLFDETSSLVATKEDLSWMASIITIGACVGGVCSGPCVAKGRRTALWIGAVPLLLAWILLANANQVWILLFTHFVSP